jgi:hypothetical protein
MEFKSFPHNPRNDRAWLHIKAEIDKKIEELRDRLESPRNDEDRTVLLRGQLIVLRSILKMELSPEQLAAAKRRAESSTDE